MENNLDQKIKNMVREEKVILPSSYLKKLDETIYALYQVHEKKKWNSLKYKMAALLAVMLIAGISLSAVAAVNLYRERMEQVSEQEKNKLNDDVQHSGADADSYSRELTSSEKERMEQLTKQYENNGVFPQAALLQVTSKEQIDKDKVCFISETSTFYLPAREMTDEELLEIIDFWHKRDLSVSEKNKSVSEAQKEVTNSNSKITKQEAEQKAVQFLSRIYKTDITGFEKVTEFNTTKDSKGKDISSYHIELSRKDITMKYYVSIDAFTGGLNEIRMIDSIISDYKAGIEFNQEKCIDNRALVDSILKDGLNLSQKVDKCYLDYKLGPDGKLAKGNVTYAVKMTDGGGYLFRYSFNTDRIYDLIYAPSFQAYEKSVKIIGKKQKEKGIIHKTVLLK